MTAQAIPSLAVAGVWSRLQRAEAPALAGLLDAEEQGAVARRLGLADAGVAPVWIPPSAGPPGGRFAEPQGPGALYLGFELTTCVAEVSHHHGLLCAEAQGTPIGTRAVFRHLRFEVEGNLAEVVKRDRKLLHPSDYGPSWAFGRQVRQARLEGVHFPSVRQPSGLCLAVFEHRAVTFRQMVLGAVVLAWNGTASTRIA